MSITEVKFKILGCFRTSLLKYSINNFFSTLKDEVSISKQCIYFHAKNEIFLSTRKSLFIKYVSQFCKLHRKLNFPNIFRLAAIYTRAPAFKLFLGNANSTPYTASFSIYSIMSGYTRLLHIMKLKVFSPVDVSLAYSYCSFEKVRHIGEATLTGGLLICAFPRPVAFLTSS